ncbi:hypothetical protein H0264_24980 [Nocardia huaxiensis]|uniref:Uncharacterized protein n=1 Tax=Nocardia huaxiensis TaxID=2755382 RepID=A0A7D6ZM75_9NOCA|nr:hypothetical protein H0264_24980 [Nocardia huaxiensis]
MWRRWFRRVTLGELLGFAAPALAGALAADAAPWVLAVALLAAGAIEGTVLGWFQAGVLRSVLPGFPVRNWTLVTAAAAVFAWAIGVVPVLFGDRISEWPPLVQAPVIAVGATVLVFSIGTAQWLILRSRSHRAALWIWANVVGWITGLLAFTLVTTPLWQPGQPAVLVGLIGLLGGLLMAAVMAAVTGVFLLRIVGRDHLIDHG